MKLRTRLRRVKVEEEFVQERRLWMGMEMILSIQRMTMDIMDMRITPMKIKNRNKNPKEMPKKKIHMDTNGVVMMNQTNKNRPTIMSQW